MILPQTLGINVFTSGKSDFTRFFDSFFAFFNVFPNKKSTFQRNVWSLSNLDTYVVAGSDVQGKLGVVDLRELEVAKDIAEESLLTCHVGDDGNILCRSVPASRSQRNLLCRSRVDHFK